MRKEDSRGECSQSARFRWLWRFTWKFSIPGKIKHFIWQPFHDSLPTNANLFRRKIKSHPFCPICNQEEESTSHVIWQCPMAQNTWALVPGRIQKLPNHGEAFPMFMLWIFQNFSKAEVEEWVVISWAIWSARNQFVFEDQQQNPQQIRSAALLLLREFRQANNNISPL